MDENKEIQISFSNIWQALLKYKKTFYTVLPIAFVVFCILTLSLPNYYNCNVTLAPELSNKSGTSSSLSSLASSFGINLGSASSGGSDALNPTLYPDMMNSVDFMTGLFPIKIHQQEDDEMFTYYDYLLDHQRAPWWSTAKTALFKAIASLFGSEKEEGYVTVNPFMLTKEQDNVVKAIKNKISCDVDKKTAVISISVTDQDPLVAATMADSVKNHLQKAITAYRTSKARVDLEYNQKLFEEAKARYDIAKKQYADFADANQGIFTQKARNQLTDLQNEMQLQYQAYTTIAAQRQAAEARVQEDTPAFTTIQNATVPVQKAGPSRARIVIMLCFLVFLGICVYILYKEKYLIPLFKLALSMDEEEEEVVNK